REQQVNQRIEKMMLQKAKITEEQLRKQKLRDCPELKDKPMAVGSMSMLSTSNYHARKFGVRAAMPGFIAKKLCPELTVSEEIREIFAEYDPHFQPMSLDEAYLNFYRPPGTEEELAESSRTHYFSASRTTTGLSPDLFEDSPSSSPVFVGTSVEEAVREMRFRIEQRTRLTASAGIAPNMMLAKVCSDKNKPNGQYRLPSTREAVMDFIQNLPVRKVSGIGKVSEKMLNALGISTCSHLGQQMALLSLLFSETAWTHFMEVSLGLGSTYIPRHEERKSMSTERTFKELSRAEDQFALCKTLCEDLAEDMKKEGLKGKTVTLKLKNVNFEVKTRALTVPYAVATVDEIFAVAKDLLKTEIENVTPQPLRLRLMGIDNTIQLVHQEPQQSFFQRAQAKRLQLQAVNSTTQEAEHGERAPVITSTGNHTDKSMETSTTVQESNSNTASCVSQKDISPSPEPCTSTSGCGGPVSKNFTCPVCFTQIKTTDLNIFNRHIDLCLTDGTRKPNQKIYPDSESDWTRRTAECMGNDGRVEGAY
uniref:DNA polymerase kappa n=1 Tax=Sphaeramia orbicularis TaxID=375764 RepID=A0A673C3Q9_9TELE